MNFYAQTYFRLRDGPVCVARTDAVIRLPYNTDGSERVGSIIRLGPWNGPPLERTRGPQLTGSEHAKLRILAPRFNFIIGVAEVPNAEDPDPTPDMSQSLGPPEPRDLCCAA